MPPWLGPPQQVMGAAGPVARVLVRTEHVSIGLRSMTACPDGLTIDVDLAARRAGMTRQRRAEPQEEIWGNRHGPSAASTTSSAPWPLPEGDFLSPVVQWPAPEVPMTTTRLDLAPVRAAARQAVPFWP